MFKVNFNCYSDPEFNIRIAIPTELKDMWENKEVLYNINMPLDPLDIEDFFVDSSYLFISTEKARASHLFMDENENVFDENYEGVPEIVYLTDNGEFTDEYGFISYDNEYFDSPEEDPKDGSNFSENFPGMWRLDWYGIDQYEFDDKYRDYEEEFPEDSWYSNDILDENEDWEDEERYNVMPEKKNNKFLKAKLIEKTRNKKTKLRIKEAADEREIEYCHRCFDYTDSADVPITDVDIYPADMTDEEILDDLRCDDTIDPGDDFIFWVKDNNTGKLLWENSTIDEESWIKSCVEDGTDPYVFMEAGYNYDFLQEYLDKYESEDEDEDWEEDEDYEWEESVKKHHKKHVRESWDEDEDDEDDWEDEDEEGEGHYMDLYEHVRSDFEKNEEPLADYLADLVIEYKHDEDDFETPYIEYYDDQLGDLYDAGSDSLFRFLACYALEGLDVAFEWECNNKKEAIEYLNCCKKIAPKLDVNAWLEVINSVEFSEDDFEESYSLKTRHNYTKKLEERKKYNSAIRKLLSK